VNARSPWLRYWVAWAVPGLVTLLNFVWLAGMRSALLGRGSYLARQVSQTEEQVRRLEGQRASLSETRDSLAALRGRLNDLREKQLGSMSDRLVPFLVDVVKRAADAGLASERIGYQASVDNKSGLVLFTAAYELNGTYERIRQCVHLLEASPQMVVIERLDLKGQEDASSLDVSVRMTVGTYFFDLDRELMEKLGVTEVKSEG